MIFEVLGIIELDSIADGYIALDAVIKAAPVSVFKAEILNPGKFIIFLTGEVASVEFSMDAGIEAAGESVLDHVLLKNLSSQVVPVINVNQSDAGFEKAETAANLDALGIIETYTLASAIDAADRSAKAASIRVRSIVSGNETGGKGVTTISGKIGDIEYAMESVVDYLTARNQLYRKVVIPGPPPELKGFLCGN
ncbi:MAG: BMC domain-containing protein [Spirochaetales bacterium]|nr:BMC domain-containing protein [Spirochaetales bacterium]